MPCFTMLCEPLRSEFKDVVSFQMPGLVYAICLTDDLSSLELQVDSKKQRSLKSFEV